MNLRAGAARSCVAHLPKVVVLVAVDDMVGRHVLSPVGGSLVVAYEVLFLRAFENCHVEVFRVELEHIDEIFPCHVDGTLFEIIAEAPVSEHLKHGVMISVVSHLFEVVVLTADAEALL